MQDFDKEDVELILQMAEEITGAKIHRTHDSVLIQNIRTRVLRNGCHSLEDYLRYLDRTPSEEPHFISALTIHTTSFFREMVAFDQFIKWLNSWTNQHPGETLSLLSIGSSSGEELYSFGLVLEAHRRKTPGFDYRLEAWDIDPMSLSCVTTAHYPERVLKQIPDAFRSFMEQVPGKPHLFTPSSPLRSRVKTRCKNILDPPATSDSFHFIACRNLLIYFDQAKIDKAISHLISLLQEKGILCTGVSEAVAVRHERLKGQQMPFFTVRSLTDPGTAPKTKSPIEHMKSRAPKTIALLEEARQHREQVGSILREAGYEVFSTRSPEEIKEAILNSRRVGMIILQNLVLLGRSPIDFIKELRLLGFKDTICVMANQIDNNFTERALAAGCNEVMEKPIRAEDLLARCKHHLGLPIKRNYFFPDLILIGASTGGTEVLVKMLAQLPSHCPPLLVVQHISPNFAQDFAKRLAKSAGLTLGAIKNGEKLQSGHLYMALHDYHIRVLRQEGSLRLDLNLGPHRNNHRPSVDVLFESALSVRAKIVACLMTGMGSDGATGLLKLRQQGALTMAQDEASSVVFGMPKEAIRIDAVDFVCNPDHMRQLLNDILKTTSASRPLSASSA